LCPITIEHMLVIFHFQKNWDVYYGSDRTFLPCFKISGIFGKLQFVDWAMGVTPQMRPKLSYNFRSKIGFHKN